MAVLRPLHRVLYTGLGPYHPDPAVSEGSLPGLNAVEMLAAERSLHRPLSVRPHDAQRELPRILEAMDQARAEAEGLLEVLGGG